METDVPMASSFLSCHSRPFHPTMPSSIQKMADIMRNRELYQRSFSGFVSSVLFHFSFPLSSSVVFTSCFHHLSFPPELLTVLRLRLKPFTRPAAQLSPNTGVPQQSQWTYQTLLLIRKDYPARLCLLKQSLEILRKYDESMTFSEFYLNKMLSHCLLTDNSSLSQCFHSYGPHFIGYDII